MEWFEAIILGLLQGFTEFLPVSSSGHLVIGRELLGVEASDDLVFEVTEQPFAAGFSIVRHPYSCSGSRYGIFFQVFSGSGIMTRLTIF